MCALCVCVSVCVTEQRTWKMAMKMALVAYLHTLKIEEDDVFVGVSELLSKW